MALGSLAVAHVTAALIALALGLAVLAARKGTDVHRLFGAGYVVSMITVNGTALGIYRLTGQFGSFHVLAIASLAVTIWGLLIALRRRQNWVIWHFHAMCYSYLGLLAAATSEAVLRLHLLGSVARTSSGVIAIGVSIAILFTIIGALAIPRLEATVIANAADH